MSEAAGTSRRAALFLAGVFAVESAFFGVIPPLIPGLVHDVGLTTTEVGILVAAYPAGVLLAAIPAMALVDRQGVRIATLAGIGILIAATLGFGWGTNGLLLDTARFVQGVGGAVAWAGALAWVTTSAPASRRGSVIGAAVGAALVGVVVGPAIGATASHYGRGPIFSTLAVVLVGLAVAGPSMSPSSMRRQGSVQALWRLLKSRRAAFGNGLLLVIGIVGGTVWSLLPLLVVHLRGGANVIAAIIALGYLLAALLNVYLGRISDRFGRMIPTFVGLAVGAVLLPLLPFIDSLLTLGVVAVVAQSMISALWTPTAAMVSDGADPTTTGQAVGVATMNAAWAAGGATGPVLAAWLAQTEGFKLPFVLVGALCAASAIVLLLGYRRRSEAPTAEPAPAPIRR